MNNVSSNESTVRNLRKPRKLSRIAVQSLHDGWSPSAELRADSATPIKRIKRLKQ